MIPKIIHQTFKSNDLPLITRWHISCFKKRNPDYAYEFYDDARIEKFLFDDFGLSILNSYKRLNIGAAKADFFRYAILYKRGGVYVDIDGDINGSLNEFILPEDSAIITRERNSSIFAQWALVYETGHPFLKKTIELILENIELNMYPHDVHRMTGPAVYTQAIKECLINDPNISYRILGTDYNGFMRPKYKLGKFFLYKKGTHWKKEQLKIPVLKQ